MTDLIIDHVLIAVRDLDAAKDTFERLGFKVTPEGRHPGRGTSNRLVVFGEEYLELISVHDPEGDLFRPNLPSFLDAREGLFIFSMGTGDVYGRVRGVRSAGVLITNPVKGSRQAGDGTTAYSWTQAEIAPEEMPGSQTFFIQHDHTIEERYTEPPDSTNHPNGVLGISSLSLAVKDADAASRRWTEAFGLKRVSEETEGSSLSSHVRTPAIREQHPRLLSAGGTGRAGILHRDVGRGAVPDRVLLRRPRRHRIASSRQRSTGYGAQWGLPQRLPGSGAGCANVFRAGVGGYFREMTLPSRRQFLAS